MHSSLSCEILAIVQGPVSLKRFGPCCGINYFLPPFAISTSLTNSRSFCVLLRTPTGSDVQRARFRELNTGVGLEDRVIRGKCLMSFSFRLWCIIQSL